MQNISTKFLSMCSSLLQARSQDLEKGGGGFFERVREVQTTLTQIIIVLESEPHGLYENWDGISRKARKFKRFFSPKTGAPKKKKGLHRNWDWFFGQNRKFKRFFRPNHDMHFTTSAPNFLWGGLFSIFHQKSALKPPKTCDFAYFTSQWEGLEPPPPRLPPGYATGLLSADMAI